jgi:NAD(P)-dependent dehydrogenase (short-subunit alcohol dehydrogenase family)
VSLPVEFVGEMKQDIPMKRFGSPAEVAKAVASLGFDATDTSGAEPVVDGGASQPPTVDCPSTEDLEPG